MKNITELSNAIAALTNAIGYLSNKRCRNLINDIIYESLILLDKAIDNKDISKLDLLAISGILETVSQVIDSLPLEVHKELLLEIMKKLTECYRLAIKHQK
jgi:hypothetical protein